MNTQIHGFTKNLLATAVASLLLVACSTPAVKPQGADDARSKLAQLQADPQLATQAPMAIKDAELAVQAAEKPQKDAALGKHLVYMADRKVDIATSLAQNSLLVDQRKVLSEQRGEERLASRTLEAKQARSDADYARNDATYARMETAAAVMAADTAQLNSEVATQQANDLEAQLAALNARPTERGMVMTLGDVQFASGKSVLKSGGAGNLDKLAIFLGQQQDRLVVIEGYTDANGSDEYNLDLSQRRADAVKSYLVKKGVAAERLSASGKGETNPVAGNESEADRQQNRRVEIIIGSEERKVGSTQ